MNTGYDKSLQFPYQASAASSLLHGWSRRPRQPDSFDIPSRKGSDRQSIPEPYSPNDLKNIFSAVAPLSCKRLRRSNHPLEDYAQKASTLS